MIIHEVIAKENYILQITNERNELGFFDVKPYFNSDVFSKLKQGDNFFQIFNGKYYIEWACGADLSADTLEAKWYK